MVEIFANLWYNEEKEGDIAYKHGEGEFKMKKFLFVLSLTLTVTLLFVSCSTTFDGYSYNIDDARKNESSFYEDYDYFFPTESEGYFIDFLICGKQLRIVKFDTKEQNKTTLYQIKSKATFLIDEALLDDTWTKTGSFPFQVEWRIIEKDSETTEGLEFIYNNTTYMLQYRVDQGK